MNFLAHIFLSRGDPGITVGNFIADYVKGSRKNEYPARIRQGIELHRNIDDFTDHHPDTDLSKNRLRPRYGKYSGVIVDLYYDHFLAKNFGDYSEVALTDFAQQSYRLLLQNEEQIPAAARAFLPYMIERNWLVNYATVEGIGRTLTGLSRRVSFENKMDEATHELIGMYDDFERDFRSFIPSLIEFSDNHPVWKEI